MKKCQCEMGGKNPVVVLGDADLALAADHVVAGAFGSTGQRCTATSRVVVEESIANQFVEMIVERTKKLKVGNGLDAGVDVGPLVDEQQFNTVLRYLETGQKEAALLVGGGPRAAAVTSSLPQFSITSAGTARSPRKRFSAPCFP